MFGRAAPFEEDVSNTDSKPFQQEDPGLTESTGKRERAPAQGKEWAGAATLQCWPVGCLFGKSRADLSGL